MRFHAIDDNIIGAAVAYAANILFPIARTVLINESLTSIAGVVAIIVSPSFGPPNVGKIEIAHARSMQFDVGNDWRNGVFHHIVRLSRVAGFKRCTPGRRLHGTSQDRSRIDRMASIESSHQQHQKDRGDYGKFYRRNALFIAMQGIADHFGMPDSHHCTTRSSPTFLAISWNAVFS